MRVRAHRTVGALILLIVLVPLAGCRGTSGDTDSGAVDDAEQEPAEVPSPEPDAPARTTTTMPVPGEIIGGWSQTQLIRTATGEVIEPTEPLVMQFEEDGTFTQHLEGSTDVDEKLYRVVIDGDERLLLIYDTPEAFEAQQHSLGPTLEIVGDVMSLGFGDESTLVFERVAA